jgi:hypothetical protein
MEAVAARHTVPTQANEAAAAPDSRLEFGAHSLIDELR